MDVVTAHNFDAVLAQKYFIICVPRVYGRLFPRLLSCPNHKVDGCGANCRLHHFPCLQHFDSNHIDGCVGPGGSLDIPLPPPPPPPPSPAPVAAGAVRLPPPVFGSPDPLITHIGSPLPPGSSSGFSTSLKKRSPDQQPALEISGDSKDPHTHLVWPS